MSRPASDARRGNRSIGTFLLLLALFSTFAYALIVHVGKDAAMLGRLIMWCPGAAALATCSLNRLSPATLGWRWPDTRWLAFAYLLPLLYAVPVYLLTWGFVPGSLTLDTFVNATAAQYGFSDHAALVTAVIGLPLLATVGMIGGITWALGEEIGWRGFLLPHVARRIGDRGACLVIGLVWAVWHYPALLWADYNAGTSPAYAVTCFSAMVVALSFILGWLRLRSTSLWPCALLHASHNLFLQALLDPMTGDIGPSRLVTSEFGIGLTITVTITAAVLFTRWPLASGATRS